MPKLTPRKPLAAWGRSPRVWKSHKIRSTSGCSQSRDRQEHSARRGGSHSSPDAGESETWFLFFFWGENSSFKLSIIFSFTPSREQTVLFTSNSQILIPSSHYWWLMEVTHSPLDSFISYTFKIQRKTKTYWLRGGKKIAFSPTHQLLLITQIKGEFISDSRH